jgi:hypothetical protein
LMSGWDASTPVSKRFFQNHSREEVEADQRTAER